MAFSAPASPIPSSPTDSLPFTPATDQSPSTALTMYNFSLPMIQDGDIILRTTDDIELHAHSLILRRVSPILAACIDSALQAQPVVGGSKPRVQLPADARVVDLLLTHLYPEYELPELQALDDLLGLLHLAVTYQIRSLIQRLRKQLVHDEHLYAHPIRVFSAASLWGLEHEAELAAEASGILDLSSLTASDLVGVSAVDYVRLLKLHKRRKSELTGAIDMWISHRCKNCQHSNSWAAQYRQRALQEIQRRPSTRVIFDEEFMGRTVVAGSCPSCDLHFAFVEGWKELVEMCKPGNIQYFVPRPPTVSPTDSQISLLPPVSFDEGDIILRSSDGLDLHAYKRVLMEASVFFKALFEIPQEPCVDDLGDSSQEPLLPVIDCQEDALTLQRLLQLIYPVADPELRSVDEVQPILEAAHKFEVDCAVSSLIATLSSPRMLNSDPVRIYALAHRYSLPSLARAAASACLRTDLDDTSEQSVAGLSAARFTLLLSWRNTRAQLIRKLLSSQPYGHVCAVCRDRWPARWLNHAVYETARRPTGDRIFDLEFVMSAMEFDRQGQGAWGGAQGHWCGCTWTEGDREWMRGLRRRIEDLPEGIEGLELEM